MNKVGKFYFYLLRQNLFSWKVLAAVIVTVLTMDTFLAPIRAFSHDSGIKLSQWGFPLIWNSKYVVLCFLLIFDFVISSFPEERMKQCYIIARIGISNWVTGQFLYILTFAWLWTGFLFITEKFLLLKVTTQEQSWGSAWTLLSGQEIRNMYGIIPDIPYLVISNHYPEEATFLVVIILGLLLGMLGTMIFCLNFYSRIAGPLAASILIFLNVTVSRRTVLARMSPASWIQMQYHYRITNTKLPTVDYIIEMLFLLTALFYIIAKIRANMTQENNRRK